MFSAFCDGEGPSREFAIEDCPILYDFDGLRVSVGNRDGELEIVDGADRPRRSSNSDLEVLSSLEWGGKGNAEKAKGDERAEEHCSGWELRNVEETPVGVGPFSTCYHIFYTSQLVLYTKPKSVYRL